MYEMTSELQNGMIGYTFNDEPV